MHFVNGEPTEALIAELDFWEVTTSRLRAISVEKDGRTRTILTRSEFKEQLEQQRDEFETELTPEEKAEQDTIQEASNRMLKALGLIDGESDLVEELDLLAESAIGGFFDPELRELSVIIDEREGSFEAGDFLVFVHEYLHLLQDIAFDSFDVRADAEGDDESLAITAFPEGEAEFFSQLLVLQFRGEQYLLSAFEDVPDEVDGSGFDPDLDVSYYLQQSFAFPYLVGVDFFGQMILRHTPYPLEIGAPYANQDEVAANFAAWSEKLNEIHYRLPKTTEQVMHPLKYQVNEPAIEVDLPATADLLEKGWTELWRSEQGEGGLKILLDAVRAEAISEGASNLRATLRAVQATSGWGGDELIAIESECGEFASVNLIEWDDPESDVVQFADEFNHWYSRRAEMTTVSGGDTRILTMRGPSGFVAIGGVDKTAVVTADSAETAEMLALWALGDGDLLNRCEAVN